MNHSYFLEPTGTFRTLKSFSMGDCSAARGSEIILRVYEFEIWKKIVSRGFKKNINRFLRFRDDVSIHVSGTKAEICEILKIILTGYPPEIQFNVETNLIYGKFLNIKIFNDPTSTTPFTSILRKENFKYDIIPYNSNVPQLMAGKSYFRTARSHTNSDFELKNQLKIIHAILQLKGFPTPMITRMSKSNLRHSSTTEKSKRFLGTTTFDKIGRRHSFVTQVFSESSLDDNLFFRPMSTPGPKLEQFVFTIRKMRKLLNF